MALSGRVPGMVPKASLTKMAACIVLGGEEVGDTAGRQRLTVLAPVR
jgi:hypothetical protein